MSAGTFGLGEEAVGIVSARLLREALEGRGRVGVANTLPGLLADEPDVGRRRDSTESASARPAAQVSCP
jgi:hypothetical protein